MNAPDNWLEICAEELQRGKLTSHPQKFKFAEARGMKDLDEVHAWMITTRRNFIEMVEAAIGLPEDISSGAIDRAVDCIISAAVLEAVMIINQGLQEQVANRATSDNPLT